MSCVVRYKNRRITMWKAADGYTMRFERPAMPEDTHDGVHVRKVGRVTASHISLSNEAMANVVAMWIGLNDNRCEVPFIRSDKP